MKTKKIKEESTTGTGASFTGGTGEQYATKFAFKGKKKKKKTDEDKQQDLPPLKLSKENLDKIVDAIILQEISYNEFKKNTKNRTNSEQLNRAVKEIKTRVNEISRIVQFTERLKTELTEQNDIKAWKATKNSLAKVAESLNHLNNKIKNLQQ